MMQQRRSMNSDGATYIKPGVVKTVVVVVVVVVVLVVVVVGVGVVARHRIVQGLCPPGQRLQARLG